MNGFLSEDALDAPHAQESHEVDRVVRYFGLYELMGILGQGGMGIVYRARQLNTGRLVALKLLKTECLASNEAIERFHAEVKAAARLDHPHILPLYEVGEYKGQHYYTMKLVEPGSLAERLSHHNAFPKSALDLRPSTLVVSQVARAIHHAHQRGLLHRDLKPGNILIDDQDHPYVADFGLAKFLGEDTGLTRPEVLVGSPQYMSPEQAREQSQQVTVTSDVFSLGVILYECLTGQRPFAADTVLETLRRVAEATPISPSEHNPNLDSDLETVCLKCLAKEPSERYPTAEALAEDLDCWRRGEPVQARPASGLERGAKWVRRHPIPSALSAMVLLSILLGVAGVTWQWRRAETTAARLAANLCTLEIRQAEDWLCSDRARQALPYLARTLRQNSGNPLPASRLLSALMHRNFPLLMKELQPASTHEIDAAFFAPNNRWIAAAAHDGTVGLWDATHGHAITNWVCHGRSINDLGFNSTGEYMITASQDGTARVWSLPSGMPRTAPLLHPGPVDCVRFSPDSQVVATVANDGKCRVWNAATGSLLQTLSQPSPISAVEYSAGSAQMLTITERTVQLWDTQPSLSLARTLAHDSVIVAASFSPDGLRVATTADKSARVWDTQTGRLMVALDHPIDLQMARFSPDGGRMLTVDTDHVVRLWDWAARKILSKVDAYRNSVLNTVQFSPDGLCLVTAADDQTARVWDAQSGQPVGEPMMHENYVLAAIFSPDGQRVLTRSWHAPARVWDVRPGSALPAVLKHSCQVNLVRFSPDSGRMLTVCTNHTAQTWATATLTASVEPWALAASVKYAVYSPDGRTIATLSKDGEIAVWETTQKQKLALITPSPHPFQNIVFSPDNTLLAAGYSGSVVQLWDARTGRSNGVPMVNDGGSRDWGDNIHSICFSPDGRQLATANHNGTAQVWDSATGARIALIQHAAPVIGVVFTPDGARLVTASMDRTTRLWDIASGQAVTAPMQHSGELLTFDLSHDGRRLVSGCVGGIVQVWDAESGQPVAAPFQHQDVFLAKTQESSDAKTRINTVQFMPRGHQILTSIFGQTARLWDCDTGLPLSEPLIHPNELLLNARFLPNGRWIVLKTQGSNVYVWDTPPWVVAPPAWLPELAEALAGTRFNSTGLVEPVPKAELFRLRQSMNSLNGTDDCSKWARWFWADRSTRSVSPSLPTTVRQLIQQ
jgi:eukaryotic-like serine/threonine-protein kinase